MLGKHLVTAGTGLALQYSHHEPQCCRVEECLLKVLTVAYLV